MSTERALGGVKCPFCEAVVSASDVSLDRLAAECRLCQSVFDIRKLDGGISIDRRAPPVPDRGDCRQPPSARPGQLVIRRRWWRGQAIVLTLGLPALCGVFAFGYSRMDPAPAPGPLFFLFALIPASGMAALAYWTLALWLNSTTLRVHDGVLSVRHGPLPWWGQRDLPVDRLLQLFLRRAVSRGRHGNEEVTWEVHAETDDDASVKLVSGVHDHAQAELLEWLVEAHLGIEEDPSRHEL